MPPSRARCSDDVIEGDKQAFRQQIHQNAKEQHSPHANHGDDFVEDLKLDDVIANLDDVILNILETNDENETTTSSTLLGFNFE